LLDRKDQLLSFIFLYPAHLVHNALDSALVILLYSPLSYHLQQVTHSSFQNLAEGCPKLLVTELPFN
jgi:hypothetical protein